MTGALSAAVLLSTLLMCSPGCYDQHPEYQRLFECSYNSDCLSGYECVVAGQKSVCSDMTGCAWGGCPAGQACFKGECYTCGSEICEVAQATEDVISEDIVVDAGCKPECSGRQCGPDPLCGSSCGDCDAGWWCDNGACQDDCAGRECGESPILGLNCGTCQYGKICDEDWHCICLPEDHKGCYLGDVYWYDFCGIRGNIFDDCAGGETCEGTECVCTPEHHRDCYSGNVYWYDSCGNRGSIFEDCVNGDTCEGGECVCSSHYGKNCYSGDVYWYDSCGNREGIYQGCEDGCTSGACCTSTCSNEGSVFCSGEWGSCCGDKLMYSYGYKVCQKSGGCLVWSSPIHCPGVTKCSWGGSATLADPCNY